ncbi:hypothetical protein GGD56_006309 [Rhizobium mongolense]|uniref:Uncharacterized protein n=1 Tax=Rhizobium mongolense TaxID=57676 RepID=A0ABR6IY08_9HYPH|nr:hypothetical protein [Rhizobium mongolense]
MPSWSKVSGRTWSSTTRRRTLRRSCRLRSRAEQSGSKDARKSCGAGGTRSYLILFVNSGCGGVIEQRLIISSPYTNIAYLSGFAPIVLKTPKLGLSEKSANSGSECCCSMPPQLRYTAHMLLENRQVPTSIFCLGLSKKSDVVETHFSTISAISSRRRRGSRALLKSTSKPIPTAVHLYDVTSRTRSARCARKGAGSLRVWFDEPALLNDMPVADPLAD